MLGVVWGMLHDVVEPVLFDAYVESSPVCADSRSNPDGIPARYRVLATGALVGVMTWIARFFARPVTSDSSR